MVTFLVPGHLAGLLDEQGADDPVRSFALQPGPWRAVLAEVRSRYPRLAERVLTTDGHAAPGFVLVVNDTLIEGRQPIALNAGDEISIVAAMAGG